MAEPFRHRSLCLPEKAPRERRCVTQPQFGPRSVLSLGVSRGERKRFRPAAQTSRTRANTSPRFWTQTRRAPAMQAREHPDNLDDCRLVARWKELCRRLPSPLEKLGAPDSILVVATPRAPRAAKQANETRSGLRS